MKLNRSVSSLVAAASVAIAALGMAGTAQADNVFWSVGVSSPGVQVGVGNGRPVLVQQPMYEPVYQPVYQPVYRAPRRVVYVQPEPVYVAPPQYVQVGRGYPGPERGWRHGHGRHDGDRFEGGRFEGERSGRGRGDHRRD
jgi:hypothetical protein